MSIIEIFLSSLKPLHLQQCNLDRTFIKIQILESNASNSCKTHFFPKKNTYRLVIIYFLFFIRMGVVYALLL